MHAWRVVVIIIVAARACKSAFDKREAERPVVITGEINFVSAVLEIKPDEIYSSVNDIANFAISPTSDSDNIFALCVNR